MKSKCSECGGEIAVPNDAIQGEILTCPDCGLDFEVVSISSEGVTLKTAETIAEDWGE